MNGLSQFPEYPQCFVSFGVSDGLEIESDTESVEVLLDMIQGIFVGDFIEVTTAHLLSEYPEHSKLILERMAECSFVREIVVDAIGQSEESPVVKPSEVFKREK